MACCMGTCRWPLTSLTILRQSFISKRLSTVMRRFRARSFIWSSSCSRWTPRSGPPLHRSFNTRGLKALTLLSTYTVSKKRKWWRGISLTSCTRIVSKTAIKVTWTLNSLSIQSALSQPQVCRRTVRRRKSCCAHSTPDRRVPIIRRSWLRLANLWWRTKMLWSSSVSRCTR